MHTFHVIPCLATDRRLRLEAAAAAHRARRPRATVDDLRPALPRRVSWR